MKAMKSLKLSKEIDYCIQSGFWLEVVLEILEHCVLQEIMLFFANILTERAIRDRPIIRQNPVMEVALTIHVVCGPHMM